MCVVSAYYSFFFTALCDKDWRRLGTEVKAIRRQVAGSPRTRTEAIIGGRYNGNDESYLTLEVLTVYKVGLGTTSKTPISVQQPQFPSNSIVLYIAPNFDQWNYGK